MKTIRHYPLLDSPKSFPPISEVLIIAAIVDSSPYLCQPPTNSRNSDPTFPQSSSRRLSPLHNRRTSPSPTPYHDSSSTSDHPHLISVPTFLITPPPPPPRPRTLPVRHFTSDLPIFSLSPSHHELRSTSPNLSLRLPTADLPLLLEIPHNARLPFSP